MFDGGGEIRRSEAKSSGEANASERYSRVLAQQEREFDSFFLRRNKKSRPSGLDFLSGGGGEIRTPATDLSVLTI